MPSQFKAWGRTKLQVRRAQGGNSAAGQGQGRGNAAGRHHHTLDGRHGATAEQALAHQVCSGPVDFGVTEACRLQQPVMHSCLAIFTGA